MKLVSISLPVVGLLTVAVILGEPRRPDAAVQGLATPSDQVSVIVANEVKHDVSLAVRDMEEAIATGPGSDEEETDEMRPQDQSQPTEAAPAAVDGAMQQSASAQVAASFVLNFDGQQAISSSWAEPDTNGAVGATQFVQWTNVSFSVYDKTTGALTKGPVLGNTLWKGFGGPCETRNSGDPIAQYDKAAGRWVMTQHATPSGGPYYQCVAVSTTSDATGSFYRYAFPLPDDFPDYVKLGVWLDAYYLSMDMAKPGTFAFIGPYLCAFDRQSMLAGQSATSQCFQLGANYHSLLPSDLDGPTSPPAGSPNYFMSLGTNSLNIWQFHVDFTKPSNTTLTGPVAVPVAAFTQACSGGVCVPQTGTSQKLDSLGDRLMYRLAYRNFGDHESLVATHSVTAGSSVGVRWYEIQSPGNNPVVYQQGTYAPDSNYRWMGSIAMDKAGDIAVGYSVSSGSLHPSISYTGRVPSDPLGTLEGEASIVPGAGSQTNGNRWGDYSAMTVDPVDDCTLWYTNEYLKANGSKNWHTRIASMKFSNCQ